MNPEFEIMFTPLELDKLRTETPGAAGKVHFNNAGSSLPPSVVVDTVINYLKEEALGGGYEIESRFSEAIEKTYSNIAKLINADKEEIVLVENASTGWCLAFHGIRFKPGDEVIVSELEYVTNMIGLFNAKQLYGIQIKVVPLDADGNFSLQQLENAITAKTKIIAVTHIASTTGGILPVNEIGRIARKNGLLYLLDACQSAGQLPLNVHEIGCDILSVTGRKYLRAPRGTGFVYIRKEVQNLVNPLFIDGHSIEWIDENGYKLREDAKRFELYEKNRALTLGLSKAVEYAMAIGIDRIWERIQYLAGKMREQLKMVDRVTVHEHGTKQCGIVTFSVAHTESSIVKDKLAENNINVSVGQAKATPLFMKRYGLVSVVRASVHYYNTEEEIAKLCAVLSAWEAINQCLK